MSKTLFYANNEESAVLARAFDEYRDSLGTCFQDVCKGCGRDLSIKHELEKHLIERAEDQNLSGEETFDAMQEQGILCWFHPDVSRKRTCCRFIIPETR